MAVTLKRKRGAVSYKEPSSDEDLSESSGYDQTTRKRTIPTRRSTRRPPADDEAASESERSPPEPAPARHQRGSRSSRTRGAPRISYKDVSSGEEDEEDPDADFELEGERVMAVRTRARPVVAPTSRPEKIGGSKRNRSRRKAVIGAPLKPNKEGQVERKTTIPSDGHKPVSPSHLVYLFLLTLMSRPGLPSHITYSSKYSFTPPIRFTTKT
jgi:hypothetical protein